MAGWVRISTLTHARRTVFFPLKTPDIKTRMLFVALAPVLIVCLAFSLFVINQRFSAAEAALAERGLRWYGNWRLQPNTAAFRAIWAS